MPKVTFVTADGPQNCDVEGGGSLMGAAVDNDIPGIEAKCGGALNCGTCHVYVDAAWRERVGECGEGESYVLESVRDRRPESRLSCQIELTDDLDGLVVRVPGG